MSDFNFSPDAINNRLKQESDKNEVTDTTDAGGSDLALITQLMRVLLSGKPITDAEREMLTAQVAFVESMDTLAKAKAESPAEMMRDLDSMLEMARVNHQTADALVRDTPPSEDNGIIKGVAILASNIEESISKNVKKFYKMTRIMRLLNEITRDDEDEE